MLWNILSNSKSMLISKRNLEEVGVSKGFLGSCSVSALELIQPNLLPLQKRKPRLREQQSLAGGEAAAEPGLTASALVSKE